MLPSSAKLLALYFEHACLKPTATAHDIEQLCAEARQHEFHGVCVNSSRIEQAVSLLEDSPVKVIATIGFPFGACDSDVKRYETEVAIDQGAHEVDMVINLGALKDGNERLVLREMLDVVEAADERPVKVILEAGLLTPNDLAKACRMAVKAGATHVKTSTGFGGTQATVEQVKQMRELVGPAFGIKASGGIRDFASALALIEAGANRLGSSSSVAIMEQFLAATSQKT